MNADIAAIRAAEQNDFDVEALDAAVHGAYFNRDRAHSWRRNGWSEPARSILRPLPLGTGKITGPGFVNDVYEVRIMWVREHGNEPVSAPQFAADMLEEFQRRWPDGRIRGRVSAIISKFRETGESGYGIEQIVD